jgi:hypothetical protein
MAWFQRKVVTKEDEEASKMDVEEEVEQKKTEKESAFKKWYKEHGKEGKEPKEKSFAEKVAAREPLKKDLRYDPDYENPKEERRKRKIHEIELKEQRLEKKKEVEEHKSKIRELKEAHREYSFPARVERAGASGAKVVGDIAKYWKEHPGERRTRRKVPRTSRARQFAQAQQPKRQYVAIAPEPSDLHPKREYDFFGQPKEYNLGVGERKYDLGIGAKKKYDLGVGNKKPLDVFSTGKKKKKFW